MNWPPHITVACIVEKDNKFLMVEEQSNGILVINHPAGHLEPGETLHQAAIRETFEETGWHVELTHVLGISKYTVPHNGTVYYRHSFIASPLTKDTDAVLDEGIIRAVWMTIDELEAQADKLRSPLVLKNIRQYLAGERYPLSLISDDA